MLFISYVASWYAFLKAYQLLNQVTWVIRALSLFLTCLISFPCSDSCITSWISYVFFVFFFSFLSRFLMIVLNCIYKLFILIIIFSTSLFNSFVFPKNDDKVIKVGKGFVPQSSSISMSLTKCQRKNMISMSILRSNKQIK